MKLEKIFWPVLLILLAVMGAAQLTSALQENQSWDESTYLAAGYSYLLTGDYRMNPEHPPLAKILAALPLLPLHPRLDTASQYWKDKDQVSFGSDFLYKNRVPADTMLLAGRSVTILFALCLGLAIALWTRRQFGEAPALLALFLYALDPNFIAHGHYVTNDVLLSLLLFLSCIAWNAYLRTWRKRDLFWAALAVAGAMATKYSAPILLPLFLILFAVRWWQQRGPARQWLGRLALSMTVILTVTAIVIAACYWSETRGLTFLNLPAHPYLAGFQDQARHLTDGHPSYLLGRVSQKGAWYYFPVAFAVKTPTAVLLLLLLSLPGVIASMRRPEYLMLTVPPLLYFLFSMYSHINIGLRHILPIYPFLFVLIAATLLRPRGASWARALPAVLCAALTVQAAETVRIHPHYLAFFNVLSGGPDNGRRYLVDSNLDWGQDLKNLKKWADAHGKPPLCISLFGSANTWYYGITGVPVPATWDQAGRAKMDCVAAVSSTVLQDVYVEPGRYQWLRELQPLGNIGYSILLYDCRKKPAPPISGTKRQ